jgi:endonuclease III
LAEYIFKRVNAKVNTVDSSIIFREVKSGLFSYKKESDLVKKLKNDELHIFHQAMVLFGRYICKAVKPECKKCYFPQICKSKAGFKPA